MPYIGNQTSNAFTSMDKQDITGNGGASYTLTHAVANEQEIEVFVNNVRQEPGVAYTVSGTALTMTGNVASTEDFYVVFQGKAIQTVVPLDGSVTSAKLDTNIAVTGSVTAGGLRLGDGDFAAFGDGLDLQILHSGTGSFITDAGTGDLHIRADNNLLIQDAAGSSNRMAVNSAGVGIGTTSPSDFGGTTLQTNHASTYSANLVSSGAYILQMLASQTHGAMSIGARSNHHVAFTTNDIERARIEQGGGLLVGTTSASMTGLPDARLRSHANGKTGLIVSEVFQNGYGIVVQASSNTGSRFAMLFLNGGLGTAGSITQTQSAVAFNTSSDYRLKENVVDMTGAIDRVKALAPKRFNFTASADNTVDGFLAHEAQTVVPEAVTGTHNEVDEDGNAVMQGIDQSKLVPLLTGALQEAIAKIETLEAKVAALEGN